MIWHSDYPDSKVLDLDMRNIFLLYRYQRAIYPTKKETSIDFLLNPFFVFRNDLYVNLLHYMYSCCYTKMKFKLKKETYTVKKNF